MVLGTNGKLCGIIVLFQKIDLDESPGILDEGDNVRLNDFKELISYYHQHKTLKVSNDETIMELFNYFVTREGKEETLLQIKSKKKNKSKWKQFLK